LLLILNHYGQRCQFRRCHNAFNIVVSPWHLEELCRSGQIVAYKDPKKWTIDRLVLDDYVSKRTAEAANALVEKPA
jgi:hypothetical protein